MPAGNFKQKHAAGRRRDTMPYRRGVPRPRILVPSPRCRSQPTQADPVPESQDAKTTAVASSMFDSLLN